jgi:hypothetical protein
MEKERRVPSVAAMRDGCGAADGIDWCTFGFISFRLTALAVKADWLGSENNVFGADMTALTVSALRPLASTLLLVVARSGRRSFTDVPSLPKWRCCCIDWSALVGASTTSVVTVSPLRVAGSGFLTDDG